MAAIYLHVYTQIEASHFLSLTNMPLKGVFTRDRDELVRIDFHTFLFMRLYETGLTMNSDRSDFVSVAGPRQEILVPV